MYKKNHLVEYCIVFAMLLILVKTVESNEVAQVKDDNQFAEISLNEVTAGSLLLKTAVPGKYLKIPTQQTEVEMRITGPVARSILVQTFTNPDDEWLEAIYAFPLPENAAVDHMDLLVGERVIQGQIKEKQQAKDIYTQAKLQGRKTALVEQHRVNLFTTSVANIPPKGEIKVRLEYQQQLSWRDQRFSVRFPMAITPRYKPADSMAPTKRVEMQQQVAPGWSILPGEIPNVVPLDQPGNDSGTTARNNALTEIRIFLDAGFPLAEIKSRHHQIYQKADEKGVTEITLASVKTLPDRDFVLEWKPEVKHQPTAAFFTEKNSELNDDGRSDDAHYGLLMLMPPGLEQNRPVISREILFVIDTSGSMGGASIRQARAALGIAIERLSSSDSFNVIEFNSFTKKLFDQPRKATLSNREYALSYVASLAAGGGTEMLPALKTALQMQSENQNDLQQVIFITDGAVGNEEQLLSFIHAELGQRRLFTVGIGSAPNSYFMKEAAHFGRGTYSFIGSPEEVQEKMQQLFRRIERPVLTSLSLKLDAEVESLPEKLPDLYSGEPLSVVLKMKPGESQSLTAATLTGRLGDTEWQQQLSLDVGQEQSGLSVHWGREKIHHWMRSSVKGISQEQVKAEVTKLALKHHLVSKYTSLVAVDITPARPVDTALKKHAIDGMLPAGFSSASQQPITLASGATNSTLYLIFGIILSLVTLAWYFVTRREFGSNGMFS